MKLIVQIPAFNEEDTLPSVFAELPTAIPGIDQIEILVIDDGSLDRTVEVAEALGAHHIVQHTSNKGLAAAFQTGIDAALRLGADIIVNTDADNQYPGDQIAALVAPILAHRADIVVGDRQTHTIGHFSPQKRMLQQLGSWVVRRASNTEVPDTVSGFRALTREAALRIFVTTEFSYTVENLIQAGKRRLTVAHVPIRTNQTRASRLHSGNWNFVKRQASTIVRTYATYEPFRTFSYLSALFLLPGLGFLGWAAFVFIGRRLGWIEASNYQSLIVGAVLMLMGAITFLFGILADRVGGNRRMMEEILYRIRRAELEDIRWRHAVDDRIDRVEAAQESAVLGSRAPEPPFKSRGGP